MCTLVSPRGTNFFPEHADQGCAPHGLVLARSLLSLSRMLTLVDINRALDRLGPLAFVPRTRPELAMYVSTAPSKPNRGRNEKKLARVAGRALGVPAQRHLERGDTRRLVLVIDRPARR